MATLPSHPLYTPFCGRLSLIFGCGLVLALLSGCSEAENRAPVPTEPIENKAVSAVSGSERVVLAFGDSLYAGYQLKPGEGLAPILEAALKARGINARVISAGVSGDTSAGGLQRFAFTVDGQPRKPDLIVLGLGGNDLLRGLDPAQTADNMKQMLELAKARGIPVVLTGMVAPPNVGPEFRAKFNALYPDLAKQYDAPLLPFIMAPLAENRTLLQADGIHPTAQGVQAMAAPLVPIVADELAQISGDETR